jgi:DNA repair exonuclease SbcCD ATPase subunit
LKNILKELAGITEKLSEAESRLTDIKRKVPPLKRKRLQVEHRLRMLSAHISKIEEHIQIVAKFRNIDELKMELRELKIEIKRLPKLEKQVRKLESEIDKLDMKRHEVDGEIRELNPKIENLKEKVKDAKVWYNKLATAKNRTMITCEFAEEVRFAHEAAKLSLHEIFANYSDMINSNLAWIWPRLYTRPDLKKIELNVEIKETEENGEKTLTPEVQLNRLDARGDKLPFNTISSHGQRVLASIAFRVAFLNLLSRTSVPRILVLDEPTIWIDDKNRERLGQILGTLVKEIKEGGIKIDQVIVISHDSVFLNAIDPEGVKHLCIKNPEGFCEVATASA